MFHTYIIAEKYLGMPGTGGVAVTKFVI